MKITNKFLSRNLFSLLFKRKLFKQFNSEKKPFRYLVADNFFNIDIINSVKDELPSARSMSGERSGKAVNNKYHLSNFYEFGESTKDFFVFLNSNIFLEYLEDITGIYGLIPDVSLSGGGIHRSFDGGFLKLHTDFPYHPKFKFKRALNLLIYLNPEWKKSFGGQLKLTNSDGKIIYEDVDPIINRIVLFETSDKSFHGHPDVMKLPNNLSRDSLALYYYTPSYQDPNSGHLTTNYISDKKRKDNTPVAKIHYKPHRLILVFKKKIANIKYFSNKLRGDFYRFRKSIFKRKKK